MAPIAQAYSSSTSRRRGWCTPLVVAYKDAQALELYDAWKAQKVMTATELEAALDGLSITAKLAEVRRRIEMRTVGLGWRQFEAKWTFFADERQHTLEMLKRMLLDDIIPYERAQARLKQLPKEVARATAADGAAAEAAGHGGHRRAANRGQEPLQHRELAAEGGGGAGAARGGGHQRSRRGAAAEAAAQVRHKAGRQAARGLLAVQARR